MDISKELEDFTPVSIENTKLNLDTTFFDTFIEVSQKFAKYSQKTAQSVEFTSDEISDSLKQTEELINLLKKENSNLQDNIIRVQRAFLEILDLINNFYNAAEKSKNPELLSVAETMINSVQKHLKNIGMHKINSLGEEPDSLYHYILDTKQVSDPELHDIIIEVVRDGYIFDGNVIRKADVIVGKRI